MASVHVNLTDDLAQFVNGQVKAGGFAGPEAFIESLVARAKQGNDQVEALLIEGLDSGDPVPLNAAEWRRIRGEVMERLSHGS